MLIKQNRKNVSTKLIIHVQSDIYFFDNDKEKEKHGRFFVFQNKQSEKYVCVYIFTIVAGQTDLTQRLVAKYSILILR